MIDYKTNQQLKEKYAPEGSELRLLQMRMLEMLIYFDSFCNKNNIKYWLSSGTCLGAIRHGGFIPWDDDMDIEMLREDYEKLIALRDDFENDRYVLQDYVSDKEYITPYVKIRDKQSEVKETHDRDEYFKYKGVFIDLFVRERGLYITQKIAHIAQFISYYLTNIRVKQVRKILKVILYGNLHYILFPFLKMFHYFFSDKNFLYYSLGYGFYSSINIKELFPLKRVRFENRLFPVPGNYDDYLRRLYGNYMKLPQTMEDFRIHFKSINLTGDIVNLNKKW